MSQIPCTYTRTCEAVRVRDEFDTSGEFDMIALLRRSRELRLCFTPESWSLADLTWLEWRPGCRRLLVTLTCTAWSSNPSVALHRSLSGPFSREATTSSDRALITLRYALPSRLANFAIIEWFSLIGNLISVAQYRHAESSRTFIAAFPLRTRVPSGRITD